MSSYLDSTGVTRLATDLKAKLAEKEHEHSAADVTSGTLPVARGGTGLTANPSMLANLGSTTADDVLKASPRPGVTGTLAIANGGTGATTATGAAANIVDGQDIEPSSVAATGEVSAKAGTTTHNLTDKAEDTRADNLEASIAYVESVTATANHAIGDYFMLGDVLMRATAAIATGEQISTSNATPATVQSQIDTLRDSVAFADVTSDATSVHSGIVAGGYELYKAGNLRYLRISAGGLTLSDGWNNLIRVAEAHRPQRIMSSFGMYPYGTLRDVRIMTDGYAQIWVNADTSKDLRIAFTYMV